MAHEASDAQSQRAAEHPSTQAVAPEPSAEPSEVLILGVTGLGEIVPGQDLAQTIWSAVHQREATRLIAGDILVVASKIVAKAQDRYLRAPDGTALDAEQAVAGETRRVVAQRTTPFGVASIVESHSGPVQAAAGVDASNLPAGSPLLGLPRDPDESARRLRAQLRDLGAPLIGVLITDTLGRAWRIGQTDAAIGAAGVVVHEDLGGRNDTHGRTMRVTDRALADELASAADLVKGKLMNVPVAVIRGLASLVSSHDGSGAAALLRDHAQDWFRYGHVEAVLAALGVDAPPAPLAPTGEAAQEIPHAWLRRLMAIATEVDTTSRVTNWQDVAIDVLLFTHQRIEINVRPRPNSSTLTWVGTGALAERLVIAAWTMDLRGSWSPSPDGVLVVIERE